MPDIFVLAEGQTLQNGKYTIIRMLAHGGFGVTYLAHHEMLDIDVCIKEFFPSTLCNRDAFSYEVSVASSGNSATVEKYMDKFLKEARSIARLHHEGIVKIHDVFRENGTAYYVMDYIDGCSLQELVKKQGPLSLDTALGYIRQAARTLDYLHANHMNHLDIKPSNMMVDAKGQLTLIDFGVAKHYGEGGHQTTTTPACISRGYSPIEQYKDGGVSRFSPVADIYPLGATLYYLLTGTTPPEATELAIDGLTIPVTIPAQIANAIRHAMQSRPADRTPSIQSFLADLTATSLGPTPKSKRKTSPAVRQNTEETIAVEPDVKEGHAAKASPKYPTGSLLTHKDGQYYCFTASQWQQAPDKSSYAKLGVVVTNFYVALYDKDSGEHMSWDEAVRRHGEDILPSVAQCRTMSRNRDKINTAMKVFGGGTMYYMYWGKEKNSNAAYAVGMSYGNVKYVGKSNSYRVRPVAPIPTSQPKTNKSKPTPTPTPAPMPVNPSKPQTIPSSPATKPKTSADTKPKSKPFLSTIPGFILLVAFIVAIPIAAAYFLNSETYGHETGDTGDLVAEQDGEKHYFTPDEWDNVPYKSDYTKLGILVNDGSCIPFSVALHDEANGEEMKWYDAVDRYGEDILPSEEQCEAIGNNRYEINTAMREFSGDTMDDSYWGKEYDFSTACVVSMDNSGSAYSGLGLKEITRRVRSVNW